MDLVARVRVDPVVAALVAAAQVVVVRVEVRVLAVLVVVALVVPVRVAFVPVVVWVVPAACKPRRLPRFNAALVAVLRALAARPNASAG